MDQAEAVAAVAAATTCPPIHNVGMTVIWQPKNRHAAAADLIFIHGLGGHPLTTWLTTNSTPSAGTTRVLGEQAPQKSIISSFFRRGKSDSGEEVLDVKRSESRDRKQSKQTCFWPFDLARKDFKDLRIMTYGYDSNPSHGYKGGTVRMTISQHGEQLLRSIADERSDYAGRPIIFVAHSLGGILVKDALIESSKYGQHEGKSYLKDISDSCFAVFFFGTPHRGSQYARYGDIVANLVEALPFGPVANDRILHELRFDAEKLSNVARDFNDFRKRHRVRIVTFREGVGLSRLALFGGKVVPDFSATFDEREVDEYMVMADHMNMCRFTSGTDAGYRSFYAALSRFVRECEDASKSNEATAETRKATLIHLLDFDSRLLRTHQITLGALQTSDQSFQWIWTSSFAEWLRDPNPSHNLFWLNGTAGSGKSTLMEYLSSAELTETSLKSSSELSWSVIHHFFDFRAGINIANNLEGLLRSLLLQLMAAPKAPQAKSVTFSTIANRRDAEITAKTSPSAREMQESLLKILREKDRQTLILLDGLDEYSGSLSELVSLIRRWSFKHCHICIASRPSPSLTTYLALCNSLRMQDCNESGIRNFILMTLQEAFSQYNGIDESVLYHITDKITKRSQGVFMWARYAVEKVIDAICSGLSLSSEVAERALADVPDTLASIYAKIIEDAPEEDRLIAGLVLLLLCHCYHPGMPMNLLWHAVTRVPECFPDSRIFEAAQSLSKYTDMTVSDAFKKRILRSASSLIDFEASSSDIRLSHQSVATFLNAKGWALLFGHSKAKEYGSHLWLHICSAEVKATISHRQIGLATGRSAAAEHLLSDYSTRYLFDHAYDYEQLLKLSSYEFLRETISLKTLIREHQNISVEDVRCNRCRIDAPFPRKICNDMTFGYYIRNPSNALPMFPLISHRLVLGLEEYLARDGQQALLPGTSWRMNEISHHSSMDSTSQDLTIQEVARRQSMIVTALGAEAKLNHNHSEILALFYRSHGRVETCDLLAAIYAGSMPILELILPLMPPSKLEFPLSESLVDNPEIMANDHPSQIMRPFWILGKALTNPDTMGRVKQVAQLLIHRGEDVNEKSGPFGTVWHSYIDGLAGPNHNVFFDNSAHKVLQKLKADPRIAGPLGNALEFAWMVVHRSEHLYIKFISSGHRTYLSQFQELFRYLIEAGCQNKYKDPNGLIPSEEQMLMFQSDKFRFEASRAAYHSRPYHRLLSSDEKETGGNFDPHQT